jgi:hypothetical protein
MHNLFEQFVDGLITEEKVREIMHWLYQMTFSEIDAKISEWNLAKKYI